MTTKQTPNTRENAGHGQVVRYAGHCRHCTRRITAQTRRQWHKLCKSPCPFCVEAVAVRSEPEYRPCPHCGHQLEVQLYVRRLRSHRCP